MRGRRSAARLIRGLAGSVLAAGVLAGLGTAPASADTCQAWSGEQPPPIPGTTDTRFHGVTVVSACDVWAVGDDESDTLSEGLIEHWTGGGSWTVAATINRGDNNVLSGISAVSANDVWAVGYTYDAEAGVSHTLIEHWDGSSWSTVTSPSPGLKGNVLSSVTATSANDGWAVGSFASGNGNKTLIEHWDGSTWQQVTSPSPGTASNSLAGVTATSATNAWAIGSASSGVPSQTLIERWDGFSWRTVSSVSPGANGNALSSVTAISATDAWAVGSYNDDPLNPKTLVEHWDGSSWTRKPSADPDSHSNELLGVTATSATDAWAVGTSARFTGFPQSLIEHWDGNTWQPITSPHPGQSNYLLAVGAAQSGVPWAVGGSDGQALVTSVIAIPNVIGETVANASSDLQAAGLMGGAVAATGNCDPSAAGTVTATSPPAGTVLPAGTFVGLTECSPAPPPPPPGIVPALSGDTRDQAAQQLEATGFVLGAVHTLVDNSCSNIGTVMSQNPAGGTGASRGTAVSITLGRAPKHCGL
jgi:PASTA domain